MALIGLSVADLIKETAVADGRDRYGWTRYKYEYDLRPGVKLNNKDTYLIVFGPDQTERLEVFKEKFKCNVLYEAPKSCNSNYPGDGPRNTLFIFEMKDEENDQKNGA